MKFIKAEKWVASKDIAIYLQLEDGREFRLLLPEVEAQEMAEMVMDRVRVEKAEPIVIDSDYIEEVPPST